MDQLPTLTPRMKRTLTRAGELARARGHAYLGTEHILLALLEDPDGIAGAVIHRLGYASAVHDEVVRLIEAEGYARPSEPLRPSSDIPEH